MGPDSGSLHLLRLPYDIRHLIYQHLFPTEAQIYIQVDLRSSLYRRLAVTEHDFSTSLLRTSRQLNEEASAYLHSMYVFNIIGPKRDCLVVYEGFLNTMRKYARPGCEPCATAFGNGSQSGTMCISLHSGAGATAVVQQRQRGERMTIDEARRGVQREAGLYDRSARWLQASLERTRFEMTIVVWILPALAIMVAWIVAIGPAFAQ
jgi:hypothetical protein